jgi:hypothetical protein
VLEYDRTDKLPAKTVIKIKLCQKTLEQWEMSGYERAGKFTCYKFVADVLLCSLRVIYNVRSTGI